MKSVIGKSSWHKLTNLLFALFMLPLATLGQSTLSAIPFQKAFPDFHSPVGLRLSPSGFLHATTAQVNRAFVYDRDANQFHFVTRNGMVVSSIHLSPYGLRHVSSGQAQWDPSGTRVVAPVHSISGTEQYLCVFSIEGEVTCIDTIQSGGFVQPAWSFDGTHIAYIASRYGLYIYTLSTQEYSSVHSPAVAEGSAGNPVFFHTQNTLIYTMHEPNSKSIYTLWLYDLAQDRHVQLIPPTGVVSAYPVIAPGDSSIAFVTDGLRLVVYDTAGTLQGAYPFRGAPELYWTADGRYIVFEDPEIEPVTDRTLQCHIHAIELGTGQETNLTPHLKQLVDTFRLYKGHVVYTVF